MTDPYAGSRGGRSDARTTGADDPYAGGNGPYVSRDEALKQQLIAQGYDPTSQSFWDMFTNIKAQAVGRMAAQQQAAQETKKLSQGAEFRGGIQPSDADYKGYEHSQLASMVSTIDSKQVTDVSSAWTDLANTMATFGQQLGQAATKSGATWKGDAAESAYNFVTSLSKWSDDNGKNAQLAADRVYAQGQAAEIAKNSMPEEVKFDWTDEMGKWAKAGPFGLPGAVDDSMKTYQASQQAHDEAAGVMSTYDKSLYGAASQAPVFSPPPAFDSSGTGHVGRIEGSIDSKGVDGGTGSTGAGSGGGGLGGSGGGSGSGGGAGGGSQSLPPTSGGSHTGSGAIPGSGSTTPTNYTPPSYAPAASGNNNSNFTGMGAMPMGPMGAGMASGLGGGSEYSSKVGRGGGGFGPGGSGAASGASSGSAKPGGVGAAEAAAGRGVGAAGAGKGGAGMGGMGGRGGKGEDDQEHQRPSFLLEGDPDEVFGSDQRTAPPVIGE